MTDEDQHKGKNVFAGAFASLSNASCILEPVVQNRTAGRDWRYVAFNSAAQRLFSAGDLSGLVLRDVNPELALEWYADLERVVTSGAAETLVRQAGRDPVILQIELSPFQAGGSDAVLVQMWDVTSEHVVAVKDVTSASSKQADGENWRKNLEVDSQYRVRNLFSTLSSVARLSAPSHISVDDYVDHLIGRLQAMGRTHSLLARLPDARLSLAELVSEELLVAAVDQDRCRADGPDVALAPHAADIVTLAIHELATNSIKFGALGDKGDISINWTTTVRKQATWLNFSWRETSPPRAFIPLRRGFGKRLIEERIPYELHGEGRLQVHNTGVLAEFAFPIT